MESYQDELISRLELITDSAGETVTLKLANSEFKKSFIKECIKDARYLPLRKTLGHTPNALEILALTILKDTAS